MTREIFIEKGFPKKELTSENHEGLLLALSSAILLSPEKEDVRFLLSIGNKITRLHVKHQILMALGVLLEKNYASKQDVLAIHQLLDKYKLGADDPLLTRIKQTDYTMQFSIR